MLDGHGNRRGRGRDRGRGGQEAAGAIKTPQSSSLSSLSSSPSRGHRRPLAAEIGWQWSQADVERGLL
jgi:hypothetical protein